MARSKLKAYQLGRKLLLPAKLCSSSGKFSAQLIGRPKNWETAIAVFPRPERSLEAVAGSHGKENVFHGEVLTQYSQVALILSQLLPLGSLEHNKQQVHRNDTKTCLAR